MRAMMASSGSGEDVAHKTLIDLQLIERQTLQVSQRGSKSGAEVIERQADALHRPGSACACR